MIDETATAEAAAAGASKADLHEVLRAVFDHFESAAEKSAEYKRRREVAEARPVDGKLWIPVELRNLEMPFPARSMWVPEPASFALRLQHIDRQLESWVVRLVGLHAELSETTQPLIRRVGAANDSGCIIESVSYPSALEGVVRFVERLVEEVLRAAYSNRTRDVEAVWAILVDHLQRRRRPTRPDYDAMWNWLAELQSRIRRSGWQQHVAAAQKEVYRLTAPEDDLEVEVEVKKGRDGKIIEVVVRQGSYERRLGSRARAQRRLFLAVAEVPGRSVPWQEVVRRYMTEDGERIAELDRRGSQRARPRSITAEESLKRTGREVRKSLGQLGVYWHQDGEGAVWRPPLPAEG